MIRLALVDDEKLFLQGLTLLLSEDSSLEVLFTAADGTELLSMLENAEVIPDIILLDMKMKPMNGVDTAKKLRKDFPDIRIVILTTYYQDSFIACMLKIGVCAFLSKNTEADKLLFAIHTVYDKEIFFSEHDVKILRQHAGKKDAISFFDAPVSLTQRELEVLTLICDQYTNTEIADKLSLSMRTVEGHRNNLLSKTGAKNTAGLVLFAICSKLVDIEKKIIDYTFQE